MLLFAGLAASACQNPAAGVKDGAGVFQAVCAMCHGERGKPNATNVAKLGVRDLTAAEFRARVTPALVEAQVMNGSKNHLMPAFATQLSPAQIKAVAAYVASPRFPE
jgi:mono/diheme cytochrome c family protein